MEPAANQPIAASGSSAEPLHTAYDAEQFRALGHRTVDMLADYLASLVDRALPVLPSIDPEAMLGHWDGRFPSSPVGALPDLFARVLAEANHLHHPHYVGHQVTAPLPAAALVDLIDSLLNNGSAVYEMGPVNTIMERRLIEWMAGLLGFPGEASGIFTSGGTVGNLTALLAARQAKAGHDAWNEGVAAGQGLVVLVSSQSHYSVRRACQVMGLGASGARPVAVDGNFRMDLRALAESHRDVIAQGLRPMAVVANACSTATGIYDPLMRISDFCRQHDLWLHVDAAHGASALLCDEYRGLLAGIDQADSVVWDAHKMLLMPALITAVIFRRGGDSYQAFSQRASYLFEKAARDEWYNMAQRTMECTKRSMGMKLYLTLSHFGTRMFGDYVAATYRLARRFAAMLRAAGDFELPVEPESNIVCFRFTGGPVESRSVLQRAIRNRILQQERFYLVQTDLAGETYLRTTIINPLTTEADLAALVEEIREVGRLLRG